MDSTENLIAKLAQDAAVIKPAAKPVALLVKWTGGASLYVAVALVLMGLRPDLADKFSSPMYLTELALLALITVTSALSAFVLSYPDMYQKKLFVWSFVAPLLLFCVFLVIGFATDNPDAPPHGIECIACITLLSLLPAAWIMTAQRHLASTHYTLAGGIALLASSSLGCLILRMVEETDSFSHLILWHYLPMMVLGTSGLWLGKKFLKW